MGFESFIFWPFAALFAGAAIVLGIIFVIFWIWMIVDCAKRKFRNDLEKIVWILALVFLHWVGMVAYYIVIRVYNPKGLAKKRQR
tara:strand:- start:572 stop:826 length:255 start_codon:yes stop_codon:yes gene_type:complete